MKGKKRLKDVVNPIMDDIMKGFQDFKKGRYRTTKVRISFQDFDKINSELFLQKLIDQVKNIRSKNNELWMELTKLAAQYAPKEFARIMKKITKNDAKITELMRKIK